jgi:hypothetical protein
VSYQSIPYCFDDITYEIRCIKGVDKVLYAGFLNGDRITSAVNLTDEELFDCRMIGSQITDDGLVEQCVQSIKAQIRKHHGQPH